MNSEFEERLMRQSFRPIPPEWRAEILRGVTPNCAGGAPTPWWREWLWPSPKAWGAMGAAWAIVIVLHSTAPSDNQNQTAAVAPMSLQAFARLQHEMEMVAQLPDLPPPDPVAPRPRTCRPVKQNIG